MEIVDAQIHVSTYVPQGYGDQPFRPIDGSVVWPIEAAIAAMEVAGVDAAVIDSLHLSPAPDGPPIPDNTYAIECARRFPGVFGVIALLVPTADDIPEQVAAAAAEPAVIGLRLYLRTPDEVAGLTAGRYDPFLSAAEAHRLPVLSLMYRHLEAAEHIAHRYPDLTLVLEHFGLAQPPWRLDDPPFARLDTLLDLARYPGIVVKWTGAPTYSRMDYPYDDLWPQLRRVVDTFGPHRLMWGSDLTRFFGTYTYSDLLEFTRRSDRLSDQEKVLILGATARRVFDWPAPDGPRIPRGWRFDPANPPAWAAG